MASRTLLATSDGGRPEAMRPSRSWRPISAIEGSACAPSCSSGGRLRSASLIRVLTHPGHSTETLTGEPKRASSAARVSESVTTPCLLTLYAPLIGADVGPAVDA